MMKTLKCPSCGGGIIEHKKSFSCENWKSEDGGCKFAIWKSNFGATFTEEDVAHMLEGKVVEKTNISKAGNPYQAQWRLNEENQAWFKYIFPEDRIAGAN